MTTSKTPRKTKTKPKPPKPWTEVEDYFLGGHLGILTADEIAAKLGRKPAEVAARVSELGWEQKAAQSGREKRLAGFHTHPSGSVSMSEAKSAEGQGEPQANPQFGTKYKNAIHNIF